MNFLVNTEENLYCDYTVNDKTVPSHHPSSGQDCDIYGRILLVNQLFSRSSLSGLIVTVWIILRSV